VWQRCASTGGGGTAQEIVTAGKLEPGWHFTAIDPSQPMLDLAITKLHEHGLVDRTHIYLGFVDDLPSDDQFDAATLIGVLHHVPGDTAKQALLHSIASRLKPQAPFILGSKPAMCSITLKQIPHFVNTHANKEPEDCKKLKGKVLFCFVMDVFMIPSTILEPQIYL
jgi:ubiquinone/menaquinone biosynthesis C-methylase UbiE